MKYPQRRIVLLALLAFIGCCFAGCEKDDDDGRITIDGFYITDNVGNHVGHHGPFDEDWTFTTTAPKADVLALFDFPATVDLSNTTEAAVNGQLIAYPNPLGNAQSYHGNVSDSVVFKLVIVNNNLQVLFKTAQKVKGSFNIMIDYSNRTTFPDKTSFRIYYSVSALNKPNYQTGYGDIRICTDASGNCF
jgi:hypothetical protein